jgi:hypothetical protein
MGAGGERLGGSDAWRGEAVPCMQGFRQFTTNPSGSSVIPQSRPRHLVGLASKPTWSRCKVAANNQSLHAGFGWFTPQNQHRAGTTWWPSQESLVWRLHRVRGVCGGSPQNRQVPWLLHKAKTEGSTGGDGIQARREASKPATHGMIEVLASRGREGQMDARSSDGELHVLTKMPL